MKIQPEFLLLRNIGKFPAGTLITGITVHTPNNDVVIDLTKNPEWFKQVKGSFIPKKGDTYFYVDENLVAQSAVLSDDPANILSSSPEGRKLSVGNFFQHQVDALNAVHAAKEVFEAAQKTVVETDNKPKPIKP